jgi:hypothetical protein
MSRRLGALCRDEARRPTMNRDQRLGKVARHAGFPAARAAASGGNVFALRVPL